LIFLNCLRHALPTYGISESRFDFDSYSNDGVTPGTQSLKPFNEYFTDNFYSIVEVSMASNFATRSVWEKKYTFESKLSTLGNNRYIWF